MEGVEDIPGTALAEGMKWDWESFPDYLDALERLPRTIDVGTHVPHGALRAYVMGERGMRIMRSRPQADIAEMARLVEEGMRAGALGLFDLAHDIAQIDRWRAGPRHHRDRARAGRHRSRDGPVGHGVFEMTTDFHEANGTSSAGWGALRAAKPGCRSTFAMLQSPIKQMPLGPSRWRRCKRRE